MHYEFKFAKYNQSIKQQSITNYYLLTLTDSTSICKHYEHGSHVQPANIGKTCQHKT